MCIECLIMECCHLLNVLTTRALLIITHTHESQLTHMIQRSRVYYYVDGDSWSQQYCWARGEIH